MENNVLGMKLLELKNILEAQSIALDMLNSINDKTKYMLFSQLVTRNQYDLLQNTINALDELAADLFTEGEKND